MSYELLNKLYYKDKDLFDSEYSARKSGAYSTSLNLDIHNHEAFFVNIPDFLTTTARIYKKFSDLNSLCKDLPKVAYNCYERNCLIDEIILTNDIEGIRSTRKEVKDVLDNDSNSTKKKKFDGMIKKYALLLDDSYKVELNSSLDIRKLYNEIVYDEIEEKNWPDGEIFRKDVAEVISGTQQVKHVGVIPESKIIHYMDTMLYMLKDDNIPMLHKIAIFHYIIGYVHPFYDGNGRLSRFISSYLLKEEFNSLVALRLSYTIKNSKSDYYKAFDIANDPHNMGDLTHFILYFSDVVEQSIDSLQERLSTGKEKLDFYASAINKKFNGIDEKEQKKTSKVLWLLIQNQLFTNDPFDRKSLANQLGVSAETAHHYVEGLIKTGSPIFMEKDGKKFIYKLDLKELINYLSE